MATIDAASPPARRRAPALGGGSITGDYRHEDANRACGELEDGEATCSLAEGPFEDGIEYAERGDIALRLEDGLGIVPGQGHAGIIAYSELGEQGTISIDGAAATIDVQDASGVVAVASGDVSIDLASVTARTVSEGELAWGIEAVSQTGNVRVDVGSVDVSGALSAGIRTQNSLGDIAINAGSVSASGSEATAIFAMNSEGAIQIDADTVRTNGDYASAIVVLNDRGWTNINVGALSTNGFSSDGIYAEGVGSLAVRVDSFETTGDYNWGANIFRLSGTAAPEEYGSVVIDFGKVKLDGTNNAAIDYLGYGRVDVNIGQFEADGAYNMIAAIDAYDAVRVQVGEAVVRGEWNDGIIARSQIGRVDLIVGSIDIEGSGIGAVSSLGDITVTAGVVRTRGNGGAGIAAGTEAGTSVAINVSDVSTDGSQARGIRGVAYNGTVQIAVDNVSTNGAYSDGVVSYAGRSVVLVRENVTTNGEESRGLIVSGFEGDAFVQADGRISTNGLMSEGIWANGRHGAATVIAAGEVSTGGDESVGIRAEGRAGDVRVDAAIVRTSGTESHGIMARTQHAGPRPVQTGLGVPEASASTWGDATELAVWPKPDGEGAVASQAGEGIIAGNIEIRVSEVSVTGEGSHGVSARGLGAARILAGDVSAIWGQAIETDMIGTVDIDLRGQASSHHGAAIMARAADVSLLIGPGARVVGATDGIVVDAVGPRCISPLPDEPVPGLCPNPGDPEPIIGPFAPNAAGVGGQVSLVNRGAIEAGTGYAVRAVSGVVALENHGQISGAISFADGDDLFDNRGLFLLSGNSDFGGGVDVLRNSGTVRLAAGSSRIDGLDRFENGGLIDLGNDRVGDVLTLAGDYVGNGNAMVRLDIDGEGRTSDSLVIEGAASGSTRLAVAGKPAEAKLTDGAGVVLIRVGGKAAEDAFVLEQDSRDIGLVRYSMKHDAEAGTYRLIGRAGAGAYRLLGTMQAIDTATVASADLWRAQGLARRDVQLLGGESVTVPRLWGLLEGGRVSRDWSSRGDEAAVDLSHRQTRYGGQIGYDLFGAGADDVRWRFGLTGGYTGSKLNYRGSSDRAELSSVNVGIYAAFVGDRVFANLLVKYDHHDLDVASTAFAAKQTLKASSFGTEGEVGLRFGDGGMFVEPALGLAWMRSRIDDLVNEAQRLDFEGATNVKGRLGARFGGTSRFANGALLTIYASGNAVHSFGDDYALTVTSGASERIEGGRLGTYGEGSLGIAYRPAAGIEAFAEGRAEFGSGYDGLTGRIGVRLGF